MESVGVHFMPKSVAASTASVISSWNSNSLPKKIDPLVAFAVDLSVRSSPEAVPPLAVCPPERPARRRYCVWSSSPSPARLPWSGCEQVSVPVAAMSLTYWFAEHAVGSVASAVAVAARVTVIESGIWASVAEPERLEKAGWVQVGVALSFRVDAHWLAAHAPTPE